MSDPTPSGKTYWRSVERLLDSPAVQEELAREFPAGATIAPDELTRRSALQLMAASFGLAGLAACRRPVEHIVPYVHPPEDLVIGVPQRYATTLSLGTDAIGVLVESHEGRPTKVEGNPLHPASHGAASVFAQASVLGLYDPDRASKAHHDGSASDWDAFGKWWATRAPELGAGGARLAVLAASFASPTLARLGRALVARYPGARWVSWDPLSEDAVFAGHGGARPVYHLDRAKVLVAVDSDLLLTGNNAVHNAWTFAQARRPERPEGILRLYAVESALSLTGANADHRLPLPPRLLAPFLAAVAREVGVAAPGLQAPALPAPIAARAALLARDLKAAGAAGVIAAGRAQPAAVHATTLAINRALGSVGGAVTLHPLDDVAWGTAGELRELVHAMGAGQVDTLVVLGGNPVYDAPADLDFPAVLGKVPHTVCLSPYRHETGRACHWHLAEAHPLEAWGDARAADGTASVVQPLVAPLLDGVSRVELLGLLASGTPQPGHDLVRETWKAVAPTDSGWHRILHDGVFGGTLASAGPLHWGSAPAAAAGLAGESTLPAQRSAAAGVVPSPAATANPPIETSGVGGGAVTAARAEAAHEGEGSGTLDLVVLPSPQVGDGSFANVAWLQELPHPLSKLTWDNAAYVAPATAAALGLATGQRVLITAAGRNVAFPLVVLPGTAEGTVAVEVGYGRQGMGRVADGVGGNAYALRTAASPWHSPEALLRRTWGEHTLAITQTHWELEGRPLVREASLAEYRHNPAFAKEADAEQEPAIPLWAEPASWKDGPQWTMAIDLSSCIGCNACVVACQAENNVPVVGRQQITHSREMHWLRIDRYFSGGGAAPEVVFQPVPCMHCENAPCEQVCPVAATVHDHQGLNLMVYNRCIGTRYCSNNCPYKVRRFNFFNYTKDTPELLKLAMNPDVTVRSRGVMEKCTYCIQRIVEGKQAAKAAGRALADGEVRTACQQTCPTQAIVFGDRTQAASAVMARKGLPRDYVLLGELNNRPRTSYQAKVRNPNPEWT